LVAADDVVMTSHFSWGKMERVYSKRDARSSGYS